MGITNQSNDDKLQPQLKTLLIHEFKYKDFKCYITMHNKCKEILKLNT